MTNIVASKLIAGLAWDWTAVIPAFDPAHWQMTLSLRGLSSIDILGVPAQAGVRFAATAEQTRALRPGPYLWQMVGSDGDQEQLVAEGRVAVRADLRQSNEARDVRGFAERMLAMVEAVLENRATIEQRRYQINNRSLERTPVEELMRLRDKLRREAAAEAASRSSRQSSLGRQHLVRF